MRHVLACATFTLLACATAPIAGCASPTGEPGEARAALADRAAPLPPRVVAAAGAVQPLDAAECLRKATLDLVRRAPTDAELASVASGRDALGPAVDALLASDAFSATVFDWYRGEFPPTPITPEGTDIEEPARIARFVVTTDRDYREILTGDYTVDAAGASRPVPTRPAAGVLATPHYMSSRRGLFNRNWAGRYIRQWGGFRPTAVSLPPGTDESALTPEAVLDNPACAPCHGDPLYGIDFVAPFATCFDAQGAPLADCAEVTGRYLNREGRSLADLAAITAASNEFLATTVSFYVSQLFGRGIARQETALYNRAAGAFVDSGYRARALIKALVTSDEYCSR